MLVKLKKWSARADERLGRYQKQLMALYLAALCMLGGVLPAYALVNPGENARTLLISWIQPVVYIGLAVFGVLLLYKRKMTEFMAFIAVAVIAVALVFYPELVKGFIGDVIQTILGGGSSGDEAAWRYLDETLRLI